MSVTALAPIVLRAGASLCALPAASVVEVCRPLPIEPIAGLPAGVLGMSVLRGEPSPVIDLGALLSGNASIAPQRFVILRLSGRRMAALAVDAVLSVRPPDVATLQASPPLLSGARGDLVSAVGSLDREILFVLNSARLVPDEVWARLPSGIAAG